MDPEFLAQLFAKLGMSENPMVGASMPGMGAGSMPGGLFGGGGPAMESPDIPSPPVGTVPVSSGMGPPMPLANNAGDFPMPLDTRPPEERTAMGRPNPSGGGGGVGLGYSSNPQDSIGAALMPKPTSGMAVQPTSFGANPAGSPSVGGNPAGSPSVGANPNPAAPGAGAGAETGLQKFLKAAKGVVPPPNPDNVQKPGTPGAVSRAQLGGGGDLAKLFALMRARGLGGPALGSGIRGGAVG